MVIAEVEYRIATPVPETQLTSQNFAPIWLPHWPPWICTISRMVATCCLTTPLPVCTMFCGKHGCSRFSQQDRYSIPFQGSSGIGFVKCSTMQCPPLVWDVQALHIVAVCLQSVRQCQMKVKGIGWTYGTLPAERDNCMCAKDRAQRSISLQRYVSRLQMSHWYL